MEAAGGATATGLRAPGPGALGPDSSVWAPTPRPRTPMPWDPGPGPPSPGPQAQGPGPRVPASQGPGPPGPPGPGPRPPWSSGERGRRCKQIPHILLSLQIFWLSSLLDLEHLSDRTQFGNFSTFAILPTCSNDPKYRALALQMSRKDPPRHPHAGAAKQRAALRLPLLLLRCSCCTPLSQQACRLATSWAQSSLNQTYFRLSTFCTTTSTLRRLFASTSALQTLLSNLLAHASILPTQPNQTSIAV